MSRQLPRPRPGRPFLRRGPDRVQVGLDPAAALVVEGLSDVASAALLRLDGMLTRTDLVLLCPELAGVLDSLHHRGALADDAGDDRLGSWRRARFAPDLAAHAARDGSAAAARRLRARSRAVVAVRGNDRVAAAVALGLASAGVGTVALDGPDREAVASDVAADGPAEPHRSWREQLSEQVRALGAHPVVVGRRAPSLVLVCSAADADLPWTDPELADDLLADGVAHLPVAVAGRRGSVGPLVLPGRTPCLWCLDLRAGDADPAWPALADQLRLRHAVARAHDRVAVALVAALAVAQAVAHLDGQEVAAYGSRIDLEAPDSLPRAVPVVRHPVCGCGWGGHRERMSA